MNKTITAKAISFIFNPVLFFLLTPFLVVFKETHDVGAAIRWTVFSSIFAMAGLVVVLIGKRRGTFSDLDVSNRKQRTKFYLILWPLLLCYLAAAFVFRGMFFSLSIISIGIVIGLFLFELINLKIKASIHIGVAVSFVLALGVLFGWYIFFIAFWIVPLIAWSRLVLKRHTLLEVFTGGALGIIITMLTIYIGQILLHYD